MAKKTQFMRLRVTEEEGAELRAAAKSLGWTVSKYTRFKLGIGNKEKPAGKALTWWCRGCGVRFESEAGNRWVWHMKAVEAAHAVCDWPAIEEEV